MKLPQVHQLLKDRHIDALILVGEDPMIPYLTGIWLESGSWMEHCMLIITRQKTMLLVRELEIERLRKATSLPVLPLANIQLNSLVKKSMAVNGDAITVNELRRIRHGKVHDLSKQLRSLRLVKTPEELRRLQIACRYTDEIFAACLKRFAYFRHEQEVKDYLAAEAKKRGCSLSFDTIVASGKDAALPHYSGSKKLARGFCVIDFGLRYKGYCSDMTRTIFLGTPSRKEVHVYELVQSANEAGIKAAVPGAVAADVDKAARSLLGPYARRFIHALGHQVGVAVHDAGFAISSSSSDRLQANMVITIEPGVYEAGRFGIRIEDDLIVGEKPLILTKTSKQLKIIVSKNF